MLKPIWTPKICNLNPQQQEEEQIDLVPAALGLHLREVCCLSELKRIVTLISESLIFYCIYLSEMFDEQDTVEVQAGLLFAITEIVYFVLLFKKVNNKAGNIMSFYGFSLILS